MDTTTSRPLCCTNYPCHPAVEFPPMQREASFNLDAVKAEIEERIKAMKGKME